LNNELSISTEPWPHVTIDDYYDDTSAAIREIWDNLKTKPEQFVTKTAKRIFISKNNLYENSEFPITRNLLLSRDTNALLDYFPDRREHKKLSLYGECILCLDASEHPIHDEAENKVLSAVTYLYPMNGQGTLLYDKDKNFVKQIEWQQNRMMVFAGKTGVTWHSYKSIGNVRLTLNSFLLR
jgi:hypothetical protein